MCDRVCHSILPLDNCLLHAVDFTASLVHKSTIILPGGFKTLYVSNGRYVYHERHRDTLTMMFTRADLAPLVCFHLPVDHAHFSY